MKKILTNIVKKAIHSVFQVECDPMIQLAGRPEYGDYQANFAMRLSKLLQKNPMDIANAVMLELKDEPLFESLVVAAPGFINIFLKNSAIATILEKIATDDRLGVAPIEKPESVVVDYANANVAKEMHVGHIRSIVLGDAIVRLLEFVGHTVIRQSHLGDWGTQFGMLIEHLIERGDAHRAFSVSDLDPFYKQAKQRFDADSDFAERARQRVVALQSGDPETTSIWKKLVKESLAYFQKIYIKLDTLLTEDDARGESFYNDLLPGVIAELQNKHIATLSDGAVVVFLDGFKGPDGEAFPMIIQKKDGGYLYATTDLAAALFRIQTLRATRLIYLTDARQKQHFAMVFAALRLWGVADASIRLEHIPFGAVLGPDNKPFKTRSGESIKLADLLAEAEVRALTLAQSKNTSLSETELRSITHDIGIGALKYADLRNEKQKDYVFDWDKLLSFEGNTAPYLQNAYVRIQAIFRKGDIDIASLRTKSIVIETEAEHILAVTLLGFSDVAHSVADQLSLHSLCDYLYGLASLFHRFYEECPILSNSDQAIRDSRLSLSDLTARILQLGLHLLGIRVVDRM